MFPTIPSGAGLGVPLTGTPVTSQAPVATSPTAAAWADVTLRKPDVAPTPAVAATGSLDAAGFGPGSVVDGANFAIRRLNGDGSLTWQVLYLNETSTFTPPSPTSTAAWVQILLSNGASALTIALTAAGFVNIVESALLSFDQPHGGAAGNVAINTAGYSGGTGPIVGITSSGMSGGTDAIPGAPGDAYAPGVANRYADASLGAAPSTDWPHALTADAANTATTAASAGYLTGGVLGPETVTGLLLAGDIVFTGACATCKVGDVAIVTSATATGFAAAVMVRIQTAGKLTQTGANLSMDTASVVVIRQS